MSGYQIPTIEPVCIVSGDTVKWTKSLSDYLPADSWVLSYAFILLGDQYTVNATNNGDGTHLVTISATDTSGLTVGIYSWIARVTKSGEVHTVGTGSLQVKPNLAASGYSSSGYDARSHVKKVLDALEATIEGRASQDQISMSINGRSISRMAIDELIRAREKYAAWYRDEVNNERIKQGLPPFGRKVQVRF